MKNLEHCPFCGAVENDTYPTLSMMKDGTWALTHFCRTTDRNPGEDLEVCITVYGKTEEEAVRRWNRRVIQYVRVDW